MTYSDPNIFINRSCRCCTRWAMRMGSCSRNRKMTRLSWRPKVRLRISQRKSSMPGCLTAAVLPGHCEDGRSVESALAEQERPWCIHGRPQVFRYSGHNHLLYNHSAIRKGSTILARHPNPYSSSHNRVHSQAIPNAREILNHHRDTHQPAIL